MSVIINTFIIYNFSMKEEVLVNLKKLFLERNSKINLSAIRNEEEIEIKHIQDSLKLNEYIDFWNYKKIVDIWTWSWFPLLPLAITNPKQNFVWIEARKKKVFAINDIIINLWLKNCEVKWWRTENHKEKYDLLIWRWFSYIHNLLNLSWHLVKKWWYFGLFKMYSEQEENDIKNLNKKNYSLVSINNYKLFDWDIQRVIYILKKNF